MLTEYLILMILTPWYHIGGLVLEKLLLVNLVLIWVFIFLNLLLTLALVRRFNSTSNNVSSSQSGKPVAPFDKYTLSGEKITSETISGSEAALIFLSPNCNPCRESMPTTIKVLDLAVTANVKILIVSIADRVDTARFVDEFALRGLIIVDGGSILNDYNLSGIPAYCLINANGLIQECGHDIKVLEKLISSLID